MRLEKQRKNFFGFVTGLKFSLSCFGNVFKYTSCCTSAVLWEFSLLDECWLVICYYNDGSHRRRVDFKKVCTEKTWTDWTLEIFRPVDWLDPL